MKKFLIAAVAAVPIIGTAAASVSAQAAPTSPAQRVAAVNKKVHADITFTSSISQHTIENGSLSAILSKTKDGDLAKTFDR